MLFSKDYESFSKRIFDVEQAVKGLELDNKDLRDKVLRKIQKRQEQTEAAPITAKVGAPLKR